MTLDTRNFCVVEISVCSADGGCYLEIIVGRGVVDEGEVVVD